MQLVTSWLRQQPGVESFLGYLNRKVFKPEAMRKWAHVFHPHLPVRTNNICESFFRVLKEGVRSTRRKRLDAAITFLAGFHESFFRNLLSKSNRHTSPRSKRRSKLVGRSVLLSSVRPPLLELLAWCTLQGLTCRWHLLWKQARETESTDWCLTSSV